MKKNIFILSLFCFSTTVNSQIRLPNTLIGKSEIEFNTSFLGSNYSEIALGEIIYRKPVTSSLKLGVGAKFFWGDLNNTNYDQFNLYPAVFFEALYFIGTTKRQKWGIAWQTGYEFYKRNIGDYIGLNEEGPYTVRNSEIKSGFYSMAGISHRAILSNRLQLVSGGFLSIQRTNQEGIFTNSMGTRTIIDKRNNFGGVIKVGLVIRIGN